MSHLALYRQFRPKTFDEVIAQNHIVETLRHQVQNGTISHAYLFCGTRGTGKTSCAKIFAKAVNCLSPKNGSPCGECEVCKKIDSNGNFDIMEIDAASNNRVDEIRDLREKVNYLPNIGKYKVYIIDEVHMLTDSAFNALLKTLEEPPSHIIFILATTEPEKLPATILSRCMRFDFKLVSVNELSKQLKKVFEETKTKYEPRALELIAKAGNGSVRDTLSVAEMCKAFSNGNITYASAMECLGLTDEQTIFGLANCIINKDAAGILKIIDSLYDNGKNLTTLLADLCDFFKNVLTLKFASDYDLKVPENVLKNYKAIANACEEKELVNILKSLASAMAQIRYSYNLKVFAEVTLLGLFYNDNLEIELLKNRVSALEQGVIDTASYGGTGAKQSSNSATAQNKSSVVNANNEQSDNDINYHLDNKKTDVVIEQFNAKSAFGEMIAYFRSCGEMLLYAGLGDVKDVFVKDDEFTFVCTTNDVQNLISENKTLIQNYLKEKFNISYIKTELYVDEALEKEKKLSDMLNGKLEIKD